jgi:hypothetical protein
MQPLHHPLPLPPMVVVKASLPSRHPLDRLLRSRWSPTRHSRRPRVESNLRGGQRPRLGYSSVSIQAFPLRIAHTDHVLLHTYSLCELHQHNGCERPR